MPKASGSRSSGTLGRKCITTLYIMVFSPYPPGVLPFLICTLIWAAIFYILARLLADPILTYLITVFSFMPFMILTSWLLWIIGVFGSSGFADPGFPEPRELLMRTMTSFISASILSLVMLLVVGIRAAFVTKKMIPGRSSL